jgi:integrase
MPKTARDHYDKALEGLSGAVESDNVTSEDAKAIRRLCAAFDPDDLTEHVPTKADLYDAGRAPKGAGEPKENRTLGAWAERLTALAQGVEPDDGEPVAGVELTAASTDADDINRYLTELTRADDISTSYVRNIGYAASKFYRYHDDLGPDPDRIRVPDYDGKSGNGWDARDLLEADERAALRTVCRNDRDRAVFHTLLYAGLRNTALRTLRIKDVEPERGRFFFNTDADGLKNIHKPTNPRKLNQATRAVQDWIERHPTQEQDHYLITALPRASKKDPTEPMSAETIRYTMQTLKERTRERDDVVTVKKPCHPHMMRHNFVSMAVKHPEISDRNIKHQIGHAPESDVMETTYSHIAGEEHNQAFGSAFGPFDTDDDAPPPWDTTCNTCNCVLAPGEDVCSACGTERGPTPWDSPEPKDDLSADETALKAVQAIQSIMQASDDPEGASEALNDPDKTERLLAIAHGDVTLERADDDNTD